jgi:Peptidase family M1 domain
VIHKLFLLVLIYFFCNQLHAQYWQQQVNVTIDVTLNDVEHTLDGFEKIEYVNNSADTLRFIWFHVWPNAYKNDKTAFSEQLLINNRTDFYFSSAEKKGYINRLNFSVNNIVAQTEDHPEHIDIIKVLLPAPLLPGATALISTPFHIKLPYNFSRGGHVKQSYQVTQWFPKPAVYDKSGWHPMPYLDQGEFYSDFGNYDVTIHVPPDYVVAATGQLQNKDELTWLKQRALVPVKKELTETVTKAVTKNTFTKKKIEVEKKPVITLPQTLKTLRYLQNNIHDFAWFADKSFIVNYDTLQLTTDRTIDVWSFYQPAESKTWKNSIAFLKRAVMLHSDWIGEYPFNLITAVQGPMGFSGGMEYPTITLLSKLGNESNVDEIIFHEAGHNWFQGILATNERLYPWMDEGMNSFYDRQYTKWKNLQRKSDKKNRNKFPLNRVPENIENLALKTAIQENTDQPINTPAEKFTEANYGLIAYIKTAAWMERLEEKLGKNVFDTCIKAYYRQWSFKHPQPEDFKKIIEEKSGKNLDAHFKQLNETGPLTKTNTLKKITPAFLFNTKNTDAKQYITFTPAAGYNVYNGLMVGAAIHNYQFPLPRFRFFLTPLFGTKSNNINGIARASYNWYLQGKIKKAEAGLSAAAFNIDEALIGNEKFKLGFRKIAPFLKINFSNSNIYSKLNSYIQYKFFFINEDGLTFKQQVNGPDTLNTIQKKRVSRTLQQLQFVMENTRVLYPYKVLLQFEQGKDFFRPAFTGNYFFNYANREGGINVRGFAGGFIYTTEKTTNKQFSTDRYHLNLTAANGYEDYTYTNYFIGRNKFDGFASQQLMMRDGGFKVRTDLLSDKVGKTDRWLAAINLTTDIPKKANPLAALPIKIPLKLFADIGTVAEGWDKNTALNRILFDAGLQISFLKETINIYMPLFYSSEFKDYINATLTEKKFWKKISFSIDIQNFSLKKFNNNLPF